MLLLNAAKHKIIKVPTLTYYDPKIENTLHTNALKMD